MRLANSTNTPAALLSGFALGRGGAGLEARGLDMLLVPNAVSRREPRAMIDRTTLLFALSGFRVLDVTLEPDGGRLVLVESLAKDGGCPSWGDFITGEGPPDLPVEGPAARECAPAVVGL